MQQPGFSQTTQFSATSDNYLTPANTLAKSVSPTAWLQPAGASKARARSWGRESPTSTPTSEIPYSVRWNGWNAAADTRRHGPRSGVCRESFGTPSHHDPNRLSAPPVSDDVGVPRQYNGQLPEHHRHESVCGLLPNSSASNGATVALRQLFDSYPQFPVPALRPAPATESWSNITTPDRPLQQPADPRPEALYTRPDVHSELSLDKAIDRITFLPIRNPAAGENASRRIPGPSVRCCRQVYNLPSGPR